MERFGNRPDVFLLNPVGYSRAIAPTPGQSLSEGEDRMDPPLLKPFAITTRPIGLLVANGMAPGYTARLGGLMLPDTFPAEPTPTLAHSERQTAEQPQLDTRERLQAYQDTGPRIDLDLKTNHALREMMEGVQEFKAYNTHEQPEKDIGNGALRLGEGAFRVPNKERFPFLFLHDSFYMSKADRDTPEGRALVESALDKFSNLYDRYGLIPNFAATPSLNATAIPLFIPMAWEWYQSHPEKDTPEVKDKLLRYMTTGAEEHLNVWNHSEDVTGSIGSYHHVFSKDSLLRRTGDRDAGYATNAGREWGWDFSTVRGAGSEHRLAPVCVNSILVRNGELLAEAIEVLGIDTLGGRTTADWRESSEQLKIEIKKKNYNPHTKTFHDYDYIDGTTREEATLAAVWILWGGVASGDEAMDVIGNLARLDSGHGLMVTSPEDLQPYISNDAYSSIGLKKRYLPGVHAFTEVGNWDANVWPPILITFKEGLLDYVQTDNKGISTDDRLRIVRFGIVQTQNEIRTQMNIVQDRGIFPEKWNPDGTVDDNAYHYEPQKRGLGWSATLAELNITTFLPTLYALEDELTAQLAPEQNVVDLSRQPTTEPQTVFAV